jgi:AraC family transcriptional regulator, regulatory protein of adaptative response / DNA-3-methyladenine glycosylase II
LPHWDKLLHIVRQARHIASLDFDPAEGVRRLGRDPIIGPLVRARPGIRVPGAWDAYETGVRALVTRRGTPATTRALISRLVERYGRPVPGLATLELTHLFPDPRVLATQDLTSIGVSPKSAAAVRSWAAATLEDPDRFGRGLGLRQTLATIGAVAGVGTQTAHHIALRLGEPDAFPLSDHQLIHCLALPNGLTRRPGTALSDQWRPWRALVVAQLWAAGRLSEEIDQRGAA